MIYMVPKWLGLWALASIFSAELSATDAILFMLSTSLAVDLYRTFIEPQVSEKKLLAVSRTAAVVGGIAGVALAVALPSVIAAVSIFYGLLAVALFVPLIYGLYWKRMNTTGALAAIACAIAAALYVSMRVPGKSIGLLSSAAVGILVGLVVAAVVSFIAPTKNGATALS
jgi:SSS family solute:Na+ symporter